MGHSNSFADINDFPERFRQKELEQVFGCIERSQSLQLIGPTGSGKSLLLKAITSDNIKRVYLKKNKDNFKIILIDLKFCIEKDLATILKFLVSKIKPSEPELTIDDAVLSVISEGKRVVLIFDSFNEVPNPINIFKILKAVYDQYRGKICYIFSSNHEVDVKKNFEELVSIGSILTENKIFISPLTQKDFSWFISEQENYMGQKISSREKKSIYTLTGGYMATSKRIIEAIKDGSYLDYVKDHPDRISITSYHFQTLLKDLADEKETLVNLANNSVTENDSVNINYLKKTYILDSKNRFITPLFKTYLNNTNFKETPGQKEIINDKIIINSQLTASEYKILKYICNNLNRFCSRDEIIEGVWGEKSIKGISDHALDQIIYRLRKKLERTDPQLKIETVWGRGHKAVLVS